MNSLPYYDLPLDGIPEDVCILANPFAHGGAGVKTFDHKASGLGLHVAFPPKWKRAVYTHWTDYEFKTGDTFRPQCYNNTGRDSLGLCVNPHHQLIGIYEDRKKDVEEDYNDRVKTDRKKRRKKSVKNWRKYYANEEAAIVIDAFADSETCCPCQTCKCKCHK
jgi:hypothetical protein